MKMLTVELEIHGSKRRGGWRVTETGPARERGTQSRLPRIARLMALVVRYRRLLQEGKIADCAESARWGTSCGIGCRRS